VPSILAAIGGIIERHLVEIGFIAAPGAGLKADPRAEAMRVGERPRGPACPNCGRFAMQAIEGCLTCMECGHSKCA
jgi:ribonucleoside-diphosphate reductase alpha chain